MVIPDEAHWVVKSKVIGLRVLKFSEYKSRSCRPGANRTSSPVNQLKFMEDKSTWGNTPGKEFLEQRDSLKNKQSEDTIFPACGTHACGVQCNVFKRSSLGSLQKKSTYMPKCTEWRKHPMLFVKPSFIPQSP